jgi:nickel-dependent lactate racemase
MRVGIAYGHDHLELEVADRQLVRVRRQPIAPALEDPAAAVRAALEQPHRYPPLRRALTPDDHIVIIVDERVPQLARLLTPILEHIVRALIPPDCITLLCAPTDSRQPWIDELPDAFQEVHVEMHDPADRRHLSYLATTRRGHRIYLNRTAVDADQLVVLSRRSYDPLLGYAGAHGAIYPAFSDEETIRASWDHLSTASPDRASGFPMRQEAEEVAWLLGAPFLVQIIEGADNDVSHVVAGSLESGAEGQRLLDARWRVEVEERADTVVLGVGGDPAQHRFADMAQALACAERVVKPNGRIILLSASEPVLGTAGDLLCQADDAATALGLLREHRPADSAGAFQWANAVQRAKIYLLSRLPSETAEDLFTVPLENARQVQRLVSEGTCLMLPDAHKTLALVQGPARQDAASTSREPEE